jgi:EAL domain-containing protein (putative c-di-GMP-specific phosphodiesterase class I)
MTSVSEITLTTGALLYEEGDTNNCAYIIASGEVILYANRSGQRVNIERRGAGAIVGELSILSGQPRAVTVEALTACVLYRVDARQILDKFENLDPILRACVETSICFASSFSKRQTNHESEVQVAQSTLRNASDIITQYKLEADLKNGLERGEFLLVYQPIVQILDGTIVGFEALMRWQHLTLGNVPPDRFIPIAENLGSIGLITNFAIIETCAVLKRMQALNGNTDKLYASVNISGKDIGRFGFVDFLAFVLDSNDLNPYDIKLEITETALIEDFDIAGQNLAQLRTMGCGISVDDFGTGYSNLAYLKSLPLTALKIDREFAGDAHSNLVSRSIVKMLLSLGVDLCVDIVAEGLETIEDVDALRGLGCHLAQGYYFYRPLSEADLVLALLGKRSGEQAA